jgi:transposase
MGVRLTFSDEEWARIEPIVSKLTLRGPTGRDNRGFIEAVVWIARTGAPWRDLPKRLGRWCTIYRRFRRWALTGRWEAMRSALGAAFSPERLLIDSTIVKAHAHAAGARKKAGGQDKQALGRSRGGFTTKIHALVSENGDLLRYEITGGQVHDITEAANLIRGIEGSVIVGDKAYDSNAFIAQIESQGMKAVIPSRARRNSPRPLDKIVYRARNGIERFFGRLKQIRRVATRYDKTACSYASFIAAAAVVMVLSGWKS